MHHAASSPVSAVVPAIPTAMPVSPPRALPADLLARIEKAVSGAGSAEFAVDPLLGHSLSAVTSFLTSVVKRSGAVIEDALYAALVRNRRFLVMQQVRIPITRAAEMYVQENGPGRVGELALASDGATVRVGHFDMIVIDRQNQVARIVEIKRGGGETEVRKRRTTERNLLCGRLQLKAFLKTLGIPVRRCESWVIDYYGRSGFRPELTVTREGLDQLFGVPIVATTDATARAMRLGMLQRLPRFLDRVREGQDVDPVVSMMRNGSPLVEAGLR